MKETVFYLMFSGGAIMKKLVDILWGLENVYVKWELAKSRLEALLKALSHLS